MDDSQAHNRRQFERMLETISKLFVVRSLKAGKNKESVLPNLLKQDKAVETPVSYSGSSPSTCPHSRSNHPMMTLLVKSLGLLFFAAL